MVYNENKEQAKFMMRVACNALTLTALSLFHGHGELLACSVCFGDPDSKISHGIFAAVCLLLGIVIFVLGGIAGTALTWAKRAKNSANSKVGGSKTC